jgi:hypothetical protein
MSNKINGFLKCGMSTIEYYSAKTWMNLQLTMLKKGSPDEIITK